MVFIHTHMHMHAHVHTHIELEWRDISCGEYFELTKYLVNKKKVPKKCYNMQLNLVTFVFFMRVCFNIFKSTSCIHLC